MCAVRENEAEGLEESELKDTERILWIFVSLVPGSEVPGFALDFKILFSILQIIYFSIQSHFQQKNKCNEIIL